MLPLSDLPKPLPQIDFYILLALARTESARYPLKSRVRNYSLGALKPADNVIYREITKLHDDGYIDLVRTEPGRAGAIPKQFYSIAKYGKVRLQEEILRFEHAAKIAHYAGIMVDETPTDIQRLKLDFLDGSER